ncbi:hypothetical protein BV22DRAFT_813682 [Leucogyrophana mollusca]|uniref:Uncharacterized protein n=1 Tax=Leucogyrophana mollusca TaxID=85980 RepID=A0ACB8B6A4_9AGAM|nr:hypothetical protein BV22DRAFT_813682 [Leucogyrophana mollusca]
MFCTQPAIYSLLPPPRAVQRGNSSTPFMRNVLLFLGLICTSFSIFHIRFPSHDEVFSYFSVIHRVPKGYQSFTLVNFVGVSCPAECLFDAHPHVARKNQRLAVELVLFLDHVGLDLTCIGPLLHWTRL